MLKRIRNYFTREKKSRFSEYPDIDEFTIITHENPPASKWNYIFGALLIMYYIIPLLMYYGSYIPALYTFYRFYNHRYGKVVLNYTVPFLYYIFGMIKRIGIN